MTSQPQLKLVGEEYTPKPSQSCAVWARDIFHRGKKLGTEFYIGNKTRSDKLAIYDLAGTQIGSHSKIINGVRTGLDMLAQEIGYARELGFSRLGYNIPKEITEDSGSQDVRPLNLAEMNAVRKACQGLPPLRYAA